MEGLARKPLPWMSGWPPDLVATMYRHLEPQAAKLVLDQVRDVLQPALGDWDEPSMRRMLIAALCVRAQMFASERAVLKLREALHDPHYSGAQPAVAARQQATSEVAEIDTPAADVPPRAHASHRAQNLLGKASESGARAIPLEATASDLLEYLGSRPSVEPARPKSWTPSGVFRAAHLTQSIRTSEDVLAARQAAMHFAWQANAGPAAAARAATIAEELAHFIVLYPGPGSLELRRMPNTLQIIASHPCAPPVEIQAALSNPWAPAPGPVNCLRNVQRLCQRFQIHGSEDGTRVTVEIDTQRT